MIFVFSSYLFSHPILKRFFSILSFFFIPYWIFSFSLQERVNTAGLIVLSLLLLLLLRRFSRVQLCATSETAANQALPSLGFSRQKHWNGLPFPCSMHESEKWKWSRSVMSDSSRPPGLQPPGSSIHGIFQARVLEWGAIAFSTPFARPSF